LIDDDAMSRAVERVLPRRLHELRRTTGLPVVFGGATRNTGDRQQLTITQLVGTLGDALRLVSVLSGRGLGGAAMVRKAPCRVSDYASTPGITHDYDHAVVEHERLTSILAFPIRVHGAVRGVLYGAVRENRPIGDVAVHNAAVIAANVARDVTALLDRPPHPVAVSSTLSGGAARTLTGLHVGSAQARALEDLASLAAATTDPVLRDELSRIHRGLTGQAQRIGSAADGLTLAPREVQVLRLVGVGATNAEIADALGLSVETVKAYLRSAMRRLDAGNRTRAVVAARAAGLL
jgi:DNA-binding CsgD family transcriptional regulator